MKLRDLIDRANDITKDARGILHIYRKDSKCHRATISICGMAQYYIYRLHSEPQNIIEKDNLFDFLQALKQRVDLDSEDWRISQTDIDDMKSNLEATKREVEQLEEELNAELHSD